MPKLVLTAFLTLGFLLFTVSANARDRLYHDPFDTAKDTAKDIKQKASSPKTSGNLRSGLKESIKNNLGMGSKQLRNTKMSTLQNNLKAVLVDPNASRDQIRQAKTAVNVKRIQLNEQARTNAFGTASGQARTKVFGTTNGQLKTTNIKMGSRPGPRIMGKSR